MKAADELAQNGVRMVRDHKRYGELCAAIDVIRHTASYIGNSCIDLHSSVLEAQWFDKWGSEVMAMREEIDRWRAGKGMGVPK